MITPRGNVTVRQEKGFLSFSMKRMLFAGMGGLLASFPLGGFFGIVGNCLGGLLVFFVILFLTHPHEGMSMASYLLRSLRGLLLIADEPSRIEAALARLLFIEKHEGALYGADLFGQPTDETRFELDDALIQLGPDPREPGLVPSPTPVRLPGELT